MKRTGFTRLIQFISLSIWLSIFCIGGGTLRGQTYTLVTEGTSLAVGDEVIIVASDYNYAMSTTQNSNNRGQAGITKSGNDIVSPSVNVCVFTLKEGTKTNTFSFYDAGNSGYICAASSDKNYLKTENTLSANSSWSISITAAGVATITAQGTYTRNVMQYNNSSSLFACYSSASQKSVGIYKKQVAPTCDAPTTPEVDGTEGSLLLSWTAPASAPANGYKVEYWLDGSLEKNTINENTTTADIDSNSLAPGTYHWQVFSKCDEDLYSEALAGTDFVIPTPTVPYITPSTTVIDEESTYNVAWSKTISVATGNLTEGITATVKTGEDGRDPVISVVTTPATLTSSTTSFTATLSAAANLNSDIYEDTLVFTSGEVVSKVVVTLTVNLPIMPKVVISPDGGTVTKSDFITLGLEPAIAGAQIYYTLDGTTPTKGSTLYSEPFALKDNATLKALAFADFYESRADSVAEAQFILILPYTKSTTLEDLEDGVYLIVCESKSRAMKSFQSTYYDTAVVAINNSVILDRGNAHEFQITKSENIYLISDKTSGKPLGYSSDNLSETASDWTITFENSDAKISNGTNPIRYNSSSPRFRVYSSSGTGPLVQLYQKYVTPAVIEIQGEKTRDLGTLWSDENISETFTVNASDLSKNPEVIIAGKNPSAFTASTNTLTQTEGTLSGASFTVSYQYHSENPGKDTAMVIVKHGKFADTAYIYAESRVCTAPELSSETGIGTIRVSITDPSDNAQSFQYFSKTTNSFDWEETPTSTTDNPINITGLASMTTYYIQLRSVCATGVYSPATSISATTPNANAIVVSISKPTENEVLKGDVEIAYEFTNFTLGKSGTAPYGKAYISIERGGTQIKEVTTYQNPYTFELPDGDYQVQIEPRNTDGSALSAGLLEGMQNPARNFSVRLPVVATPTITVSDAPCAPAKLITLDCDTADAAIFYTLDGTTPTSEEGTRYTAPFTLTATATLKAIAIKAKMNNSEVSTEEITILTEIDVLTETLNKTTLPTGWERSTSGTNLATSGATIGSNNNPGWIKTPALSNLQEGPYVVEVRAKGAGNGAKLTLSDGSTEKELTLTTSEGTYKVNYENGTPSTQITLNGESGSAKKCTVSYVHIYQTLTPTLDLNESIILDEIGFGETQNTSLVIKGANIMEDVRLSLTQNEDNAFKIADLASELNLNCTQVNAGSKTLNVIYEPQSTGTHTAVITFHGGIETSVSLTGSCAASPVLTLPKDSIIPAVYDGTVTINLPIKYIQFEEALAVNFTKNTNGAFALNKTTLAAAMTETNDTLKLTYTAPATVRKDTAFISVGNGTLSKQLKIYASTKACNAPTTFTVVDSVISADITIGGTAASKYTYRYAAGATEDVLTGEGTDINTTVIPLSGLNAKTKYFYQVKTWCNATKSSAWSTAKSFTTKYPTFTEVQPEDGATFENYNGTPIAVSFAVSNIHLGSKPVDIGKHLPYGTVNAEIFRDETLVESHSNLTAGFNFTPTQSGEYTLKVRLQSEEVGALSATEADNIEEESFTVAFPLTENPVFVTKAGSYYDSVQIEISCETEGAVIKYSFDGENYTTYDPEAKPWIKATTTLYAKAEKTNFDGSEVVSAAYTIVPLYKVADAAALYDEYAVAQGVRTFRIEGNLIVTHVDSSVLENRTTMRRIFVQDEGITKDNNKRSLVIWPENTAKNINLKALKTGDKIRGVIGKITVVDSLLRFTPVNAPITAVSHDNPVFIDSLTIAEIKSDKVSHQSALVCIKHVSFEETEKTLFEAGTFYTLKGQTGTIRFRTNFWNADYIGEEIPKEKELYITGILSQAGQYARITPRNNSEIVEAPYIKLSPETKTLKGIYTGTAIAEITADYGNWYENPEIEFLKNGRNAFSLSTTVLSEGAKTFTVSYQYQSEAGKDTAIILVKYAETDDTLRVYAVSKTCEKPSDVKVEEVTQTTATLDFGGEFEKFDIQYHTLDNDWTNAQTHTVAGTEDAVQNYTLEGLTAGTLYYFRIRGICAVISEGDDVCSDWVSGEFTTSAELAKTITLTQPVTNTTTNGPVHLAYEVKNFDLGNDGSVRVAILNYTGNVVGDTIVKEITNATVFDTFLLSGRYLASVRLVNTDGSIIEGNEGDLRSQRAFNVNLPDVAKPVVSAVAASSVSPSAKTYYDSVRIAVSCEEEGAELFYSLNGRDFTAYHAGDEVWVKESGKVYAKAEKYRMDAAFDTLALTIVKDAPSVIFDAGRFHQHTISINDLPWTDENIEGTFSNLRADAIAVTVKGTDSKAAVLTVSPATINRNKQGRETHFAISAEVGENAPVGNFIDTIVFTSPISGIIDKIVADITVTAFHAPHVVIAPQPAAGTKYTASVEVSMSLEEAENTKAEYEIRYTTDGTTPTTSGLLYEAPFTLKNEDMAEKKITVKALAFDKAGRDTTLAAHTRSVTYTLVNPAVIEPAEGDLREVSYTFTSHESLNRTLNYKSRFLTGDVKVAVKKRAADASVALTVNTDEVAKEDAAAFSLTLGSAEGLHYGEYQDTLVLSSGGKTLYKTVVNLNVTAVNAPKVKITPEGGNIVDETMVEVSMEAEEGYAIHYTTDGSTPTAELSGSTKLYEETFALNKPANGDRVVVKALAFGGEGIDLTLEDSLASVEFVFTTTPQQTVATPTFSPKAGEYKDSVRVSIACETEGALIYYTTNGETPTTKSTRYETAFKLGIGNTTVKAVAVKSGMTNSKVASALYNVSESPIEPAVVATPTFSPKAGEYKDSVRVSITCETEGAAIYYTLDGSEPDAEAVRYEGAFKLGIGNTTVKAIAVKAEMTDSKVSSALYKVSASEVEPTEAVSAPVFTPAAGNYENEVEITMESKTEGALIYYTLDGEDPTVESTLYEGAFTLGIGTHLVKAFAVKDGMKDSWITMARYTIKEAVGNEAERTLQADIYPNPNRGKFTIELQEEARIEIFGFSGSILKSMEVAAGKQVVELNRAAGIYFVRITAGGRTIVKPVVVK